ncbi:hypothetical protein EMCRGX_G028008 [Ephydatia muelleri]
MMIILATKSKLEEGSGLTPRLDRTCDSEGLGTRQASCLRHHCHISSHPYYFDGGLALLLKLQKNWRHIAIGVKKPCEPSLYWPQPSLGLLFRSQSQAEERMAVTTREYGGASVSVTVHRTTPQFGAAILVLGHRGNLWQIDRNDG